jgi:hypothetical protein
LGGVPIAAIGVDLSNNRVELALVGADAEQIKGLAAFHPAVWIRSVEAPAVGHCANSNCANPLKAGLKGYKSGSFACMTGFIVSKGGIYYWATAGHCNSGATGWRTPSEAWQHPAGTVRGSIAYHGWFNNSKVDVSLIQIATSQASNKLCIGGSICSIVSITSNESPVSGEVIGQSVSVNRQNGQSTGTLHSYPYTLNVCKSDGTCRTITELRRASFPSLPGDSGAPVYSGAQAIGSLSAPYPGTSHTVYSHVGYLESQAGVAVKTN